jgi:hypothetical protein
MLIIGASSAFRLIRLSYIPLVYTYHLRLAIQSGYKRLSFSLVAHAVLVISSDMSKSFREGVH